ncbi:MAG: ABC transporter permease, partial [Dehalococcoidia bacterium]|nr:ABC transporter permease [Dehalococcoidia bacterium]
MNLIESFRTALTTLAARRLRSALTVLGIVIGVGAVISLMSVGAGASQMVTSQITSMGSNLVFISPGSTNVGGVGQGAGSAASLTLQDAQAIAEPGNVPEAVMVAAQTQTFGQVVAGSQNTRTRVLGTTPDYQYVRNATIADGDFISQTDVQANSTVAVLGSNVAQTLFPDADPLGSFVKINSRSFRVIGVLASKGGGFLGSEDDMVIIPITTMTRLT